MIALPFDVPGPDNDLNEKIDYHVQTALVEEDAMIYAFGERWGPEPHVRDKYFGFKPGNGIHDIHMNQGSVEEFQKYNGVWQDGGMLIHLPSDDRWVAVFLAFQSQCWHTDDEMGNCTGDVEQPAEDKAVVIIAATVNPAGHDPGPERVLLLNSLAAEQPGRYYYPVKQRRLEGSWGAVQQKGCFRTGTDPCFLAIWIFLCFRCPGVRFFTTLLANASLKPYAMKLRIIGKGGVL
jgi:hypothetical protein